VARVTLRRGTDSDPAAVVHSVTPRHPHGGRPV